MQLDVLPPEAKNGGKIMTGVAPMFALAIAASAVALVWNGEALAAGDRSLVTAVNAIVGGSASGVGLLPGAGPNLDGRADRIDPR